ncbi:major facilitator superfamily domain-containing protein [Aspergillus multicolor]|uniref:major facilitator superfamily domain-containing protein n=1 Tax=Aspergillus multicolor TaxID=41759 RepID=UPI003CCD75C1
MTAAMIPATVELASDILFQRPLWHAKKKPTPNPNPSQEPQHSIFTTPQKWLIISVASYSACFSTLSSLIYYPAIPALSSSLHTSVDKINLTVTVHMAVAAIAPALIGDLADISGRRLVYILMFNALSISGTFLTAYGVLADVTAPAERGSFAVLVSFAVGVAPTLGPILGGPLTYAAGWPWIFGFLCIASGACLDTIVLFLPETCREIVGDGSIPVPRYLQPLIPGIMGSGHSNVDSNVEEQDVRRTARRFPNPFKPITILARPDNTVIVIACGLLYTVYTCITASLATLFVPIYSLSQWEAGLIYIPFGVGGIVSTFVSGRMLNSAWRDARLKRGLPLDKGRGDDLDNFPVEKARLRVVWVPMCLTVATVVGSGWALHFHTLDFSVYNTLLVEKSHRSPAAAQASSDMIRCALAAIAISFLQNIIDALGIGWAFTLMGGLCLLATGMFVVNCSKGMAWRQKYRHKWHRMGNGDQG